MAVLRKEMLEGTSHLTPSAGARPSRTLIVDDHPMFRMALREILSRQPGLEVVAEVGSVAEAIAYLAEHAIDAAIVDVVFPEDRGTTFVRHVRETRPECKVLALSGVDEPAQIAEMLRAGASGFALKTQPVAEIMDAFRRVLDGVQSIPAESREQVDTLLGRPGDWPLDRLTAREREIFDRLVAGDTNDDIAKRLFISKRTVETHRLRIMKKLEVRSLTGLFQIAKRHGLLG